LGRAALIAGLVAADRGGPLAQTTLRQSATDRGQAVPLAIAAALEGAGALSATAAETLEGLREHPSAEVRRKVAAAWRVSAPVPTDSADPSWL
jgi:hypothetical protein